MTGGYYDDRRSKLKFMKIIRQNTVSINAKENELEKIRNSLQDILLIFAWLFDSAVLLLIVVNWIICLYTSLNKNTYDHK